MLTVLDRAGRVFLAEFLVLFPGLLFVTERLARMRWSGTDQALLFYGTLAAAVVATIALVATFSGWIDCWCERSDFVTLLLDGDGFLGLCVYLAVAIVLMVDAARHPVRAEALRRLFGGGQAVVIESYDQSSSINPDQQAATESILSAGVSEYGADAGCAIVMDVKTGWIIAAATAGVTNDVQLLTRAQELGSVVAPLAIAAAIELDPAKYGPETVYDTSRDDPHYEKLPSDGGHHWFPTMTLREALSKSSNIVLGKLAWDVGSETLFDTYSGFGLGSATGLWGEVEPSGFLLEPHRLPWGTASRSRMGIEQGLTVTPIQIVSVYQALANKGVRLKPQLTKGPPQELSRPVSPETAAKVLEMMMAVVSEKGTARRAMIEGVKVAGKTGTAMKPADGVPTPDQRLASFCGIAPADCPRLVAMVLLDFSKGAACHQGGNTAAPLWRRIIIGALRMN